MTKADLISVVATKTDMKKKDAEAAVNAVMAVIEQALVDGDKVQLVGFGTFETSERAARTGRNPQTGAATKIKACTAPKFKAGKALKDLVNKR